MFFPLLVAHWLINSRSSPFKSKASWMDDSQLGNPWIVFEIVQAFWEGFFADVHIVKI